MSESAGKLVSGDEKWGFDLPVITLGRSSLASVPVTDSQASRIHALLRMDAHGRYQIIDWGSRNGTFLNGKILLQPEPLKSGDKISIGEQDFFFKGNENISQNPQTSQFIGLKSVNGGNSSNVVAISVRLLQGYNDHLRGNDLLLSWMLGQWLKRQEAQVQNFGGVFDQVAIGHHVSYWKLQNEAPGVFSQVAFECVKSCLLDTEELGRATMKAAGLNKPFLAASAGLHYGPVKLVSVGTSDALHESITGDTSEICKEVSERAMNSACPMLSSENFQTSLGSHGIAHPYCMAMVGPRRQSVVLYQLTS